MYTTVLGFATLGGGLWDACRRPTDKQNPLWTNLGFNPNRQMQKSIDQFLITIKNSG
jgi:hypothetical protein